MKVAYFVIVFTALLGLTFCLPANKNEQTTQTELNKEVDFLPLGDKNFGVFPPGGVIDVDAGTGFFGENPNGRTPFTSTFSSIEAAFARMQRLINQLLGRLPNEPDFPELHIPNFGNVDLGKGNTTSVTKVINGHKVTINDTEYKSDEANGSSIFKVHIVEVHPDAEDTPDKNGAEPVPPPKRDPESVEETLNNEIPKIKDNEDSKLDDNIETLDGAYVSAQRPNKQHWNKISEIENFEDNKIDSSSTRPYDLSNDIYVNQLLSDSGAKTNPDAEIFAPAAQYYPEVRSSPSRAAPFQYIPSNNVYEQFEAQPFQATPFYAPQVPVNNPYYNRYQPEQIMIVPLSNDPQRYFVPDGSSPQGLYNNLQNVPTSSINKTPDKPAAPST